MKQAKDNFSDLANLYKQFRPRYPVELYDEILNVTPNRDRCWDCATGNGQVAQELAKYFYQVFATDISAKQLDEAEPKDNISYLVQRAEQTTFPDHQFDLITVAQAIHWFDVEKFNQEATRVAKPGATIAVWGYGLLRATDSINVLIDHFYTRIVGAYWDQERKHIDQRYAHIKLDIEPIRCREDLSIKVEWTYEELIGYLNTWSSVQKFIRLRNENPVDWIIRKLPAVWNTKGKLNIEFPIFLILGRK